MEPKRLILQTYIVDDIQRDTQNTYKRFPILERASQKCFKQYALRNKVDYKLITSSDKPNYNSAHWLRMEMFDQPEYDEVLYVDCDILINPNRMEDNIFDYEGTAVQRLHFYEFTPYRECNMGVAKWTKEECRIMNKHINDYYHPTHNQKVLNQCYWDHVGEFKHLPYKFNVTHRLTDDVTFRHYAGSWKRKDVLRTCKIWKYWR